MRRLMNHWRAFWSFLGSLFPSRKHRRQSAALRRNERRHALDAFEPRVVLNADAVDDDCWLTEDIAMSFLESVPTAKDSAESAIRQNHTATASSGSLVLELASIAE